MRKITTTALIITGTLFLTACGTTPTGTGGTNTQNWNSANDARTVSTVTTAPVTTAAAATTKPAELNIVPIKRNVFFDYNSNVVKSEYTPMLEAHAKYLVNNPVSKAIIQGNTDARGGAEYNLALGQQRAENERKALELLGVPASQLEAISFGKSKPRTSGNNEAAWADNRRADIVYQAK